MIRWPCLLMLLSFVGCGVKTGADAVRLDGRVLMCRTVEAQNTSWYLCRTHPTVTPDVLREAEELSVREGVSLPIAIGRLTGWRNY